MSFSIVSSDPGVARIHIACEFDSVTTYILRLELANLLRRRPKIVELSLSRLVFFDGTTRGLLLSFFDLLRAQGGRVVLRGQDAVPVATGGPRDIERLLTASARPGST